MIGPHPRKSEGFFYYNNSIGYLRKPIMARHDEGLDYFPFNVDFFNDDKLQLIEAEFGERGVLIAIKLLCKIYKENGYYYQWGDDECLLFARNAGAGFVPGLVKEVVNGLVRRSFFDKGVFDSFKILTSNGIQKRFLDATARRKSVTLIGEYLVNADIDIQNVYSHIQIVYILKQSRVKESKVKESKDSNGEAPSPESVYETVVKELNAIATFIAEHKPLFHDPYVDMWNLYAEKFERPKIKLMPEKRRRKLNVRLHDKNFDFVLILKKARESNFLMTGNFFSFDWIIENETNFLKILEGNYNNGKQNEQVKNGTTKGQSRAERANAAANELVGKIFAKHTDVGT